MKTPLSSILLVLFGAFIGSFGSVFLKAASHHFSRRWQSVVFNWKLMAGIVTYLVSSVFFVLGVKHGEVSILYPLVAAGYVWTMLWSKIFFQEPMTRAKITGLGVILLGIVLLNLGNH